MYILITKYYWNDNIKGNGINGTFSGRIHIEEARTARRILVINLK
jgi:hypothetical protein